MISKEKKLKKEKKLPEPFFKEIVTEWFSFCRAMFDEDPSFTGSAPRDLKNILQALRERAEKSDIEWTIDIARQRFIHFLNYAWKQKWLREHWLLSNINRQKDTIFFSIRAELRSQPANHPFE
jgi:hypothetical protein